MMHMGLQKVDICSYAELKGFAKQVRQSDEEDDSQEEEEKEEQEEEEEEEEQVRKKYELRERRPIQQAKLYQPSFGGQGTRQAPSALQGHTADFPGCMKEKCS